MTTLKLTQTVTKDELATVLAKRIVAAGAARREAIYDGRVGEAKELHAVVRALYDLAIELQVYGAVQVAIQQANA